MLQGAADADPAPSLALAALRQVADAVVAVDSEGRIIGLNPAAERLTGWAQEAGVGRPSGQVIRLVPEGRRDSGEVLPIGGVGPLPPGTLLLRKDGSTVAVEGSVAPIADAEALTVGSLLILRDVSRLRRVEGERDRLRQDCEGLHEWLRLQVERMPLACITLDLDFRIGSWNPAAEALFGFNGAEALGQTPYELFVPPSAQDYVQGIEQRLRSGDMAARGVNEIRTKDGRTLLCEWHNTPLLGDGGAVIGFLGMAWDVTARIRSEEALRAANQRLEALVRASPLAIIALDAHGRVTIWNPAAEQIFGWTEPEVLDQPLPTIPEDFRGEFARSLSASLRGQEHAGHETRRLRKDGSLVAVSIWTAPLFDARGEACGRLGIIEDITRRKRAEAEREQLLAQLQAERALLNAVLQQMPSGVTIAEAPSGRLLLHNDEAERLLGHPLTPAPEVDGRVHDLAVHPDGRPYRPEETPIARAIRDGEVVRAEEVHFRRGDGALIACAVNSAPIHDREGKIIAAVSIFYDISERRRAEAARSELLRRIVTAQEEERHRIARELHDQMGQHLTALMLGLKTLPERIRDRAVDGDPWRRLQDLANRIGQDVHRIALELRPTALDDWGLATALANHVKEWSQRSRIMVQLHCTGIDPERLPLAVETALYRVAQEALTNVLKHARASRVSLIVERRPDQVLAILEDNGLGFDTEAVLGHPDARRRLGLLGMEERLALLGGTLEIESTPGAGTTLFVRIPLPACAEDHHHG